MAKVALNNLSKIELVSEVGGEKVNKSFCCQICGYLMKSPLQTYRGNVACSECYNEAKKRNADGKCPIDAEAITPKQIFKDKAKEKEILNLRCFCLNKLHGCTWSGTIRELQNHICEHASIQCSLCKETFLKQDERMHQQKCVALIKIGECYYKDDGCDYKATTLEDMSEHMTEKSAIHLIYRSNQKRFAAIEYQYQEVENDNITLKATVDGLEKKLKDSEESNKQQISQLTQALSELSKKIRGNQENKANKGSDGGANKKIEGRLEEVANATVTNTGDISDLDMRVQLHENTTFNGHLLWKINNIQKRRNEAITGKVTALHSAPCFTHQYGYKFCLRVYLNGDGMGKGSHLSLFLVIMKSEYDNVLQWPFKKTVKFTLVNQQNRDKDVVERMVPNRDSSSFQKPRKEMNVASGCPLFFEIDRLDGEGFLKEDSLFIDVRIE